MSLRLVDSNVVIVAHQFNPSIMGQAWLVNNGILALQDFGQGCIFTDVIVNVVSSRFGLLVLPDRAQFAPRVADAEQQSLVQEKLGAIVEALPHTPYHALGLNFTWHEQPDEADVATLCRQRFFVEKSPIHRAFDAEDARFGAYLSKDALGCRLRLDVKPLTVKRPDGQVELLQFNFNLNLDVVGDPNPVPRILEVLGRWNEAKAEAFRVVHLVEGQTQP